MGKPLYYLAYGRGELKVYSISTEIKPVLRVKGARADRMFKAIMGALDGYGLAYEEELAGGELVIGLPGDVGLAVTMYVLLAYGAAEPDKYVAFLERLMEGRIPLAGYLPKFFDIAVELSEGQREGATISDGAAQTVSKMMRELYCRSAGYCGAEGGPAEAAARAGPLDAFL